MKTSLASKHWVEGSTPAVLKDIHAVDVNIAVFDRDTSGLEKEVDGLVQRDFELKVSGEMDAIIDGVAKTKDLEGCALIREDIKDLLQLFGEVSGATSFRLLLATVKNNMCRKFHTDINDLRMLCTYAGPGTLWLKEDHPKPKAWDSTEEESHEEGSIQQAKTGSVIILKGALYPKESTKAILHRSPTIEESGQRRLLLRIDTNAFLNFE